ncbi:hypothetical protein HELRODRAFT_159840 [Helobdella robusta]|uniref:Rhodanese domain-containing protein n=1 Tax=Helobdella robusta TaxID=6412 RepID=T1EPG8_HELRO|nr:hypothetical protein HELRODRAFT_159840 [Helobdella robusta]ESO13207.1 hypothetical protein HELRODRAFT_159840 [Helobdella robusta]
MVYWVSPIGPNELFNMINREFKYACITDVMFLLLLDARAKEHYNESHIITAKLAQRDKDEMYTVSLDYELECRTNIVVYDHSTTESDLINQVVTPALQCAKTMWECSKQTSIQVLTGGYKDFSAFYPFLRTRKLFYLPKACLKLKFTHFDKKSS